MTAPSRSDKAAAGRVVGFGATHQGKVRKHNEDAFGIDAERQVAVVADGMGGLTRGDEASRIVVASVMETIAAGGTTRDGLLRAHERIRELVAQGDGGPSGATAVTLTVTDGLAELAWVGDSRGYLWHDGRLRQLTRDHTFVQDLVELGAITQTEAQTHPNRNVVTRAIGLRRNEALQIAETQWRLIPGDRLLLCTDGLYGYLDQDYIVQVVGNGGSDEDVVKQLLDLVLTETEAGDNVTVVSMSFGN